MLAFVLITVLLLAAVGMQTASLVYFGRIRRYLCSDVYGTYRNYGVLSAAYLVLIVFFLLAYVVYLAFWVGSPMLSPISYLVTALLFFGAVFVGLSVMVVDNSISVILGVKLNELDNMTGLMSKSSFEMAVQKVLDDGNNEYFLVVIDMDCFKAINDTHGHSKGDEIIRSVADILRGSVRSSDLVARFGGDEFLLLVPDMGRSQLQMIMDRIEKAVMTSQKETLGGACSGISYGAVPICGGTGGNYQAFFEKADRALYKMKRSKQKC